MTKYAAFIVPVLALALAACAELRWSKPGTDEATLAQDHAACAQQARQTAARAGNFGMPPVSDPRFGTPSGPSQTEQIMQEQQALDRCMRAKGYALTASPDGSQGAPAGATR
jgi:hypothetical protein